MNVGDEPDNQPPPDEGAQPPSGNGGDRPPSSDPGRQQPPPPPPGQQPSPPEYGEQPPPPPPPPPGIGQQPPPFPAPTAEQPGPGQPPTGQPPAGQLRSMTLGDILDGMFRLVQRHWRAFGLGVGSVMLTAMVVVPLAMIALFGALGFGLFNAADVATDPFAATQFVGQMLAAGLLIFVLIYLLIFTVYALLNGVSVQVAASGYRTGRAAPWDSVKAALRRVLALLGALLLQMIVSLVLVGLPFIPLVLLGALLSDSGAGMFIYGLLVVVLAVAWSLIVTARLSVATPALMVEGVGPVTALQRSNELVKGRTGWVIGTLLVVGIVSVITFVVVYVALGLLSFVLGQLSEVLTLIAYFLGVFVLYTLLIALAGSAQTLIYFDRRVRKEGYDLTEMAGQLGAPTQPSW